MQVIKRNGDSQAIIFDKITQRINKLTYGLKGINVIQIAKSVIQNIQDGIHTSELDVFTAKIANSYALDEPDYRHLANRVFVSNMHKDIKDSFSKCMLSYSNIQHREFIVENAVALDSAIDRSSDYLFDYSGLYVLSDKYLWKKEGVVYDLPQYLLMRIAITLYADNLDAVIDCYGKLKHLNYTHATPTLFNALNQNIGQLNSCFVLGVEDNIEDIFSKVKDCAIISKVAGGIGINYHKIRSAGQIIKSTGGLSSGIIGQIKVFNEVAININQGGRRNGAIAIYLEPWHGDIMDFLKLKHNQGAESQRARNLFYALWIPDLFMKRAEAGEMWSLFSEDTAPHLSDTYGEEFEELYERYEREGRAVGKIPAQKIINAICESQRESGTPYVCFKDHVNYRSNHKNVGIIRGSNLCAEIMQYNASDSYTCCTLASVNLNNHITKDGFDFDKMGESVRQIVRNLNQVIDRNNYPLEKCSKNSLQLRPIGIGVQGLANVFFNMRIPYLSDEAEKIDLAITEAIYYYALSESCELAKKYGTYDSWEGSPASKGELQFDLWRKHMPEIFKDVSIHSGMFNWTELKAKITEHGLRNSVLLAFMPTVSTSQILGNTESFEPITANILMRSTISGKFIFQNNYMINHLQELGLWNTRIKNKCMNNDGSIADIYEIPKDVREIYKTVWELSQKKLMYRSALRSAFIDQSQSFNIYIRNIDDAKLRLSIFTGWKYGLKTGSYYTRGQAATTAMKNNLTEIQACEIGCTSCGA